MAKKINEGAKPNARDSEGKPVKTSANPSAVDTAGRTFDPKMHAAKDDGSPHTDSTGRFIAKDAHFNAPARVHYGDTYRHGEKQ